MKELSIEEKAKRYDEAIKEAKECHIDGLSLRQPVKDVLEHIFPELKESEDEKIRKNLISYITISKHPMFSERERNEMLAWLEKQGAPAKLSEEEQNRFAKGVLTSCALSFIDYLDAHKYEGKMCVSNGECKDIENAFHNAMWDKLHRYYCKYIEKQGEHANFLNKIQIGDRVTRNEDGVLVNLSQLNRVAKKQGEQKPVVDDKDAEKAAEEYRNFRMSCGIKDPVMLNEIEEAYYEGAIRKQNPVEWSDEDERNVINICAHLRSVLTDETIEKYQNWLKSIKDKCIIKSHLKPTKDQIDALDIATSFLEPYSGHRMCLEELYEQLKAL